MIFSDFLKALTQIFDPRFRKVLFKALGLTTGLLILSYILIVYLIGGAFPDTMSLPFIGEVGYLDEVAAWVLKIGFAILMAFLMFPVASVFVGFFLDDVTEAVESEFYPKLPPVTPLPSGEVIADSLRFLGIMLIANLIGFVFYLFSGPFAPFVFYAVNGYLLGREYFQLVAMRRLGEERASKLRKDYRSEIFIAGTLMAIPLSIPLIGLIIPVLGVATFTHMFHRLNKTPL